MELCLKLMLYCLFNFPQLLLLVVITSDSRFVVAKL